MNVRQVSAETPMSELFSILVDGRMTPTRLAGEVRDFLTCLDLADMLETRAGKRNGPKSRRLRALAKELEVAGRIIAFVQRERPQDVISRLSWEEHLHPALLWVISNAVELVEPRAEEIEELEGWDQCKPLLEAYRKRQEATRDVSSREG